VAFFHVEISAGMRRARVFNLSQEDLAAQVVEPWLEQRTIVMGDREWNPAQSSLKILEGPQLETRDLSFGQGWANAERDSRNVSREIVANAPPPRLPDAFAITTGAPEAVVADLVAGHGGEAIHWAEAREKLDGRDPEVAAVILVLRQPGSEPRRS
jgi:hypothetical protein